MKFNFTPNDIISGSVEYGLEQFLRDLFEQAKLEVDCIPTYGDEDRKMVLNGHYKQLAEVCYALAEGYTLDDVCRGQLRQGSSLDYYELYEVLKGIEENNLDNIEIMKAIATREHLNASKTGITEKDARGLIKSKVVNIINLVLKEEGLPINYTN